MVLSIKGFMVVLPDFRTSLGCDRCRISTFVSTRHSDFSVCGGGRHLVHTVARPALSITLALKRIAEVKAMDP